MLSSLEARLRCLEICRGGRVDISEKLCICQQGRKIREKDVVKNMQKLGVTEDDERDRVR